MKVAEMIEWLKTQDQEAEVEVLKIVDDPYGYTGYSFRQVPFDISRAEYVDMRGNQFAVGQTYADSRTLFLGETP